MSDHNGSENMKDKLMRALKHKAVLTERSKLLQQQVEDFRSREASMNHIASELLQRQRELNYMLHRASSVLHQMQDTNLALSAEFTHLVKELPAPREGEQTTSEWEETISRVNDLFRRTHELAGEMQDEIFRSACGSPLPDPERDIAAISVTSAPIPEPVVVSTPEVEAQPEQSAPSVEVEQVEMHADVPSTIEAEIIEQPHMSAEPETVEEICAAPASAPEIVEATIIEPQAEPIEQTDQDESVDDLFRRLNAVQADSERWKEDGTVVAPARKPSLLSRLFGTADED